MTIHNHEDTVQTASAQAALTINVAALRRNYASLRARSGTADCAAVVKANAYGLGLEPVVRAFIAEGCHSFFVAHAGEGAAVRLLAPQAQIFILNGFTPGAAATLRVHDLIPVLNSLEEIDEWTALSAQCDTPAAAALHLDTGMNRLGLPLNALAQAKERLNAFTPTLLLSHFISAENAASIDNQRQIRMFHEAAQSLPPMPLSLCNSSGLFLEAPPTLDVTRPGYALYGGNPTPGRSNPMEPVIQLKAQILALRDIAALESVGYNARWKAKSARRIATIGIGYADGLLRSSFDDAGLHVAHVCVNDVLCPIIGRVSMDLTVIDVTDAGPLKRGDWVELIGHHQEIDVLGRAAGTSGYEILTSLGRRYRREYREGDSDTLFG